MRKTLTVIGAFVLALILSATLCIVPGTNRQAHAENRELGDAAIAESNFVFVAAGLSTVLGMAVVAKRHLVSRIR